MQTKHPRRTIFSWGAHLLLLSFATLAWVHVAFAFPVTVEAITKVPLGENPKLVFLASDAAEQTVVTLTREDGKKFTYTLGQLRAEQVKEVVLDGRVGRHAYKGEIRGKVGDEILSSPLEFETVVAPPIRLNVDREELDLQRRRLTFTSSAPIAQATLSIFDVDGARIHEESFALAPAAANQPITLTWHGGDAADIVRLELKVTDENGFFKAVALTPWSVSIPHEEVLFSTNSAQIEDSEVSKLEASLEEIRETLERFEQIKGVQLFIAGHTDTVGKPAHNAHLSRLRAQAIGKWFVENGVPTPVHFEGFGESSPKVKTADEVDEPRNRRVDYILSVEPPPLPGRAHAWKRLK